MTPVEWATPYSLASFFFAKNVHVFYLHVIGGISLMYLLFSSFLFQIYIHTKKINKTVTSICVFLYYVYLCFDEIKGQWN